LDFALSVNRAARPRARAIDDSGSGVVLTARSEGFVAGRPDIGETVRRLRAYADAGADCLFAPGIRSASDIEAVVRAVAPKPVNVVVNGDFTTVEQLTALGVRRISIGATFARTALTAFLAAAKEVAEHGTFSALAERSPERRSIGCSCSARVGVRGCGMRGTASGCFGVPRPVMRSARCMG
jgi:methylisocitrate lyase